MDLQKGRLRQGGLNMSKMGRKITALMLALLMATSTCSVGLAAQEQVGSIGTAVSASAGDTVTVTFDSQGGAELAPVETTAGSTVLLPENPSKPVYAFKGWYTEPNGEGNLFYIDTPVTESLTVYAYWEEIPTGIIDEQPSDNFYEIFVRAFCDSDGDGIGDFNGLASKMDYLQDLGITGIWLMPITESGSYHGYDTVDYYSVEQDYGTMEDFENMLDEAHAHGIKVIMDLVVNHCGSGNPWFQDAITNPETSPYRDYFKIEKSTDYDEDKDNNATDDAHSGNKRVWQQWRATPGYRYLGLFGGGMPDLNYDNPAVHEEMINAGQFWLEKGVDGFRLDAARHIYGDYLDTMYTPEIADKNAAWWKEFRAGMEEVNPDVFLVGEVWEPNTDRMVPFVQDGALQNTFDFSLASELLEVAQSEHNGGFVSELCEVFDKFGFASNGKFEDCTFLTNHDQNRTMSVMEGNEDHAKTAASLYLTLPGNTFIYYGEEVGLQGMKPDQNIREPMPWYESNEGEGLTDWLNGKNKYSLGGETSVEAQVDDPDSMLNHYKELLSWRNEIRALKDGDVAEYDTGNDGVASYIRMTQDQSVLVATNLTGEAVTVEVEADKTFGSFDEILRKFSVDTESKLEGTTLTIAPYSTVVLGKEDQVVVTLDSQGGSTLAPIWTTAGSTVLLPENPSKPGYAFKGWYTEPNGEGNLFYIDTPVTESLTVYAYWEEIPTGIIDEQPSDNFYEIFVRAFCDSDGDGIGDFNGLASKMDYLQDLGITGIWLMPITESGSYHGYDTVDYYSVEQDYGTMEDFENMLDEAHAHGIKVIMDLVVNHCGSGNPWFQDAITNPETSPYRDYFKIEKSTDYDEDKDNNATDDAHSGNKRVWQQWRATPGYRYLGLFGGGMPDLNYDNPAVHEEMINAGQFWLEKGVDGFRLDAARHIYGDYLDTMYTPEIADKNAAWWKEFRAGMEEVNPDVFLVGEVWEPNTDRMVPFVQDGALQNTFDFSLASELLEVAQSEHNGGFVSELCEVFDKFGFASNGKFEDCTFLTNHDQNRTMSVMEGNEDHAKTAASLYLTLPGNTFIYYGEEVGLQGMKPDQNIREPMPWYESNEGEGLTDWLNGKNKYSLGGETSVEAQVDDPDSMLNHYKELLSWRNEIRALKDGDVAEYDTGNNGVASYIRMTQDDSVLVATNLTGNEITVEVKPDAEFGSFSKILKKFSVDTVSKLEDGMLTIAPYSTVVLSGDVKPGQYSVAYSKNVKLSVDGEEQKLANLIGLYTADAEDGVVTLEFVPAVEGKEIAGVLVNGESVDFDDSAVFTYELNPSEQMHTTFAFTVVDKRVLRMTLETAQKALDEADKDAMLPAVLEAMENAIAAAQEIIDNPTATQTEIDQAWSGLLDALHCIDFVKGDKTYLEELVAIAEQIDLNEFTSAYNEEFNTAFVDAQDVLADENAMEDEINAAADALEQALLGLVRRADTSELEAVIAKAKGLNLDEYVEAGKAEMAQALEAANVIVEDRDATQEDVDNAAITLTEALAAMRKIADKDALRALIASMETVDLSGFTAKSVAAFQQVLNTAKAMANDAALSEDDQDKVDAMSDALQDAYNSLEKKETTTHNSSSGSSSSSSSNKTAFTTATAVAITAGQSVGTSSAVRSVISDTTLPFALKRGSAYCFKMTVTNGSAVMPNFTVGNGDVFKTQFVAKIGNDYYFRIWATGAPGQSAGIYTQMPGEAPQCHCVVTVA